MVAGQCCNTCVIFCCDQAPKFTAPAAVRTNAALILRENKLIRDKQAKEAAVIKVTYGGHLGLVFDSSFWRTHPVRCCIPLSSFFFVSTLFSFFIFY